MGVGLHTRLKPGAEERYDAPHAAVWRAILEANRQAGIRAWLIFRDGLDLFPTSSATTTSAPSPNSQTYRSTSAGRRRWRS